jgi:hypothetical protein
MNSLCARVVIVATKPLLTKPKPPTVPSIAVPASPFEPPVWQRGLPTDTATSVGAATFVVAAGVGAVGLGAVAYQQRNAARRQIAVVFRSLRHAFR